MGQSLWTNEGTYLHSPKLSQQMREQSAPKFLWRQFVDIKDALGKNAGDSAQFTKRLRIDTRGGTLVETTTMPSNRIRVIKDSVTVTEWGNAVPFTQKIETLSEFKMRSEYEKGLVQDQKDTIDNDIATQFKTAKFKVVCTATTKTVVVTTNGTATATAANNPSDANIRAIVDLAKKKQIPKLGNYYASIGSTEFISGIYDYLQSVAQYADPEFRFGDEIGRYYGTRFMEDNNILSNAIGTGSAFGEGVVFGDEAVCEAVALPEELRYEETDMGRSKKLAWYAILGFKKIWDLSTDDLNSTGKGIERIIHVTSA